jgi:hypothetical protein
MGIFEISDPGNENVNFDSFECKTFEPELDTIEKTSSSRFENCLMLKMNH